MASIKADIVIPKANDENALPVIKRTMARYCPSFINTPSVIKVVMALVDISVLGSGTNTSPWRKARAAYIAMGMAKRSKHKEIMRLVGRDALSRLFIMYCPIR